MTTNYKLHPWQEKILVDIESGGFTASGLSVIMSGRQTGKSMYYQAVNAAMEQVMNNVPSLETSEKSYNGIDWYIVQPNMGGVFSKRKLIWEEMDEWCTNTMGQGITGVRKVRGDAWEADCRWLTNGGKFWFRQEKDRTMFVLRWS